MKDVYTLLDYETRSLVDLKKVGAYEYARHKSTEILCVSWREGTREGLPFAKTYSWTPARDRQAPLALIRALLRKRNVAHNALFEQLITRYVLVKYVKNTFWRDMLLDLDPADWTCTAALAAVLALPRKLEHACAALKLPHQKDMAGHRLMLKMSKPRRQTKNNRAKWHCKWSDLERLIEYCESDIAAEAVLFAELPPLTPTERQVWELDQRTNLRGFSVDRALIKKILRDVDSELRTYEAEISALTGGRVTSPNKVKVLGDFVRKKCGVKLKNLQAKTIRDIMKTDLPPLARRLLEIRANASKTSTAKYEAMELRSRSDGRVRDLLMYHGASTGRWTGMGVQIQNFPRGTLKDIDTVRLAESFLHCDLDTIRLVYGEPLECFSSILRSSITASVGHEIFCGDYAAIEVRVLFWLAKHARGVAAYRDNRKIYEEMAAIVYNVPLEKVTKAQREVGKRIILGCGYGMGWKKFAETCEQYDVPMTAELAKRSVKAYRETHSPVPELWSAYEKAAIEAVRHPGRIVKTNFVKWFTRDGYLFAELPSGRRLAYYGPEVKMAKKPWGEMGLTLFHWGVHPKTKKWVFDSTYGGRIAENICQAVARDVMAGAALRLDRAGYPLLFSVHDELANEKKIGQGSIEEYTRLMSKVPKWADGLPLKVETWSGTRYKK